MYQTFILLIALFLAPTLWALTLIDVRPFQFGSTDTKGIRVLYVDRDQQRITRLIYLDNRNAKAHIKLKEGITIQNGCRVQIGTEIAEKQYLVRSTGPIETSLGMRPRTQKTAEGAHYFVWGAPLSHRAAPELVAFLNRFSKASRGEMAPLQAAFISEDGKRTTLKPITHLHTTRIFNTQELGQLGEVVTDLVFFSYGYTPLPSKFEHNHGFDGLYVNVVRDTLFITESKFRPSEAKSVGKYMKECLAECKIHEMYTKIKDKNIQLPAFWSVFNGLLKKGGRGIYRTVQRIKVNGAIETLVAPFVLAEWNKCSVPSITQLSFEQKIKEVQSLIDRLGLDPTQRQKLIRGLRA